MSENHMSNQLTSFRGRLASRWIAVTLAASFLALIVAPQCTGQQPIATAVITDRAALATSDKFSMPPNQFKLTDTGNVYFASGGNTALFHWNQETGARQRLLQTNDPLELLGLNLPEKYAGSLLDTTGTLLQVNAVGHAAFLVSAAIKGEADPAGIFVFDGSSYHEMKTPLSIFSQILLNNQDRVAVLGSINPFFGQGIYISGPDMGPIEVAVVGKPAPGTGGSYSMIQQLIGFNDAGQVAFLADINGGATSRAIFLFDGTEVHLVAKNGSANGDFNNLNVGTPNYGVFYALNNNGKVAIRAMVVGGNNFGIWIGDASGVSTKLASQGDATGVQELGNCSLQFLWLRGFDDSDRVLYDCNTSSGARHALFLKSLADPAPRVVFKRGQSGGPAGAFATLQQASLNNAGKVAFLATLTGGTSPMGWYLAPGDTDPIKIAAEGEGTPAGGTFGLGGTSTPALINAGDQVVFLADILKSNAAGLFSWTSAGGVRSVVSSSDSLPDGANTVLRAGPASISDTETLVRVLKAGGQATFYAKQLKTGESGLRKIVAEFDQVPDVGTVVGPDSFSMNGKGEVVFTAALLGSNVYPRAGILANLPDSGLQKAVLAGDGVPGGDTITSFGAPQLNNQSQVAFKAGTTSSQGMTGQGVFIAPITPAAEGIQAVARQGDAMPGGGPTFGSFGNVALNDSGQVAFRGNGTSGGAGLFVGTGGGTPVKVVRNGDSISPGVSVGMGAPNAFKLNAAGQVAYLIGLTGNGKNVGIFLGTPGANGYTQQALAINGDSAPVPGGTKFMFFREETVDLNSSGQVAFWAILSSPEIANGWFLGSAPENLSPRLLQNQPLPGGGQASTIWPGNRLAALADSGEMAIYVTDTSKTDFQPQIVIAGADGELRKFAWNGEKAEGTGSEFGKLYPTLVATPSGRFLFSAVLLNGPDQAGIFIDTP
jgi:hypothetical protein